MYSGKSDLKQGSAKLFADSAGNSLFLCAYSQALQISPFTLDDFASALEHTTLDPRCILLGEIHSVLTSNIASDGVRITGTTQASVDALPYFAATDRDEDGMTIEERERWATAALDHCRGWDRKARPRASDGRMGWETHLLGILTQVRQSRSFENPRARILTAALIQ